MFLDCFQTYQPHLVSILFNCLRRRWADLLWFLIYQISWLSRILQITFHLTINESFIMLKSHTRFPPRWCKSQISFFFLLLSMSFQNSVHGCGMISSVYQQLGMEPITTAYLFNKIAITFTLIMINYSADVINWITNYNILRFQKFNCLTKVYRLYTHMY